MVSNHTKFADKIMKAYTKIVGEYSNIVGEESNFNWPAVIKKPKQKKIKKKHKWQQDQLMVVQPTILDHSAGWEIIQNGRCEMVVTFYIYRNRESIIAAQ